MIRQLLVDAFGGEGFEAIRLGRGPGSHVGVFVLRDARAGVIGSPSGNVLAEAFDPGELRVHVLDVVTDPAQPVGDLA